MTTKATLEQRVASLVIAEQEQKVRAARAVAEREELTREFVFDMYARGAGRDAALQALARLKISLPNLFEKMKEPKP